MANVGHFDSKAKMFNFLEQASSVAVKSFYTWGCGDEW